MRFKASPWHCPGFRPCHAGLHAAVPRRRSCLGQSASTLWRSPRSQRWPPVQSQLVGTLLICQLAVANWPFSPGKCHVGQLSTETCIPNLPPSRLGANLTCLHFHVIFHFHIKTYIIFPKTVDQGFPDDKFGEHKLCHVRPT